jgi:hypothetical protein
MQSLAAICRLKERMRAAEQVSKAQRRRQDESLQALG